METLFFVKVVVSFFSAGLWIAGTSILAERLGSHKGGLISILPSTVLISLIFVALIKNTRFAAGATAAIPMGVTIDVVFLTVLILLLGIGLTRAVAISLSLWLVLAVLAREIHSSDFLINSILYLLVLLPVVFILKFRIDPAPKSESPGKSTRERVLMRALFGGSVVGGTTFLAGFAGTYWVGLFSTFPAVMLCNMIILTRSQGKTFARAFGRVMIIASTNIIIYAYGISVTYPSLGVVPGTILSFSLSCIWIVLLYPLIGNR
jgi:MFS family permease